MKNKSLLKNFPFKSLTTLRPKPKTFRQCRNIQCVIHLHMFKQCSKGKVSIHIFLRWTTKKVDLSLTCKHQHITVHLFKIILRY